MFDLTQDDDDDDEFSTKFTKRRVFESDSDLEVSEGYFTPNKRLRGGSTRASSASPSPFKGKGKMQGFRSHGGPCDAVIATWRRGDDDLEPSTKMLALVEYLKEWDSTGDKTICYSQCKSYSPIVVINHLIHFL